MVAPTSATATEGRRRDRVLSNCFRNADRRRLPRVIIIDPLDLSPRAAAAVRNCRSTGSHPERDYLAPPYPPQFIPDLVRLSNLLCYRSAPDGCGGRTILGSAAPRGRNAGHHRVTCLAA